MFHLGRSLYWTFWGQTILASAVEMVLLELVFSEKREKKNSKFVLEPVWFEPVLVVSCRFVSFRVVSSLHFTNLVRQAEFGFHVQQVPD